MKITNVSTLNDLAKSMLRHKTVLANKIAAYRDFQRDALIQFLISAGLYQCYVVYEYGKKIDGEPLYVRGKLSVELCTESSDVTNPYAVMFDGGCIKHWFLTDDADYFSYLINEVFPKMEKCKD